jgi:hypothetical protein
MGEAKRTKTFRQHMGLKPGDMVTMEFFTPRECAAAIVKAACEGCDEGTLEIAAVAGTLLRNAASGSPTHCLLCRAAPEDIGLMGLVKSASNKAAVVVCRACRDAADSPDELRKAITAAIGAEWFETSSWPS